MPCVYLIAESWDGPAKIGVADDPQKRLRELKTGNARPLALLCYREYEDRLTAECVEWLFHDYLSEKKISGEWFAVSARWLYKIMDTFPHVHRELEPSLDKPTDLNPEELGKWIMSQSMNLVREIYDRVPDRFEEVKDDLLDYEFDFDEASEPHYWHEWYEVLWGEHSKTPNNDP